MPSRSKPSPYPPLPFHAVRAISGFSATIVIGILAFFCHQLWSDGYKLPWTLIIVMLAGLVTIAFMLLTSIISCCSTLSPIFNLILNIPLLLLWVFAFSLLTWNMYGALGHSCSLANWGNSSGIMVCQLYKTIYAFMLFATLAQIGQIVVDVRARRSQSRLGNYGKMEDNRDIKIDDIKPLTATTPHDTPMHSDLNLPQQYRDDRSHQLQEFRDEPRHTPQEFRDDIPGWRPGMSHNQSYTSHVSDHDQYDNRHYGYDSTTSVQMQDFTHQRPQSSTHYDSRDYHAGDMGYGYGGQGNYYQGRY